MLNASSESKSSFHIENGLLWHYVAFVDFENENYGIILQLIKTSIMFATNNELENADSSLPSGLVYSVIVNFNQ